MAMGIFMKVDRQLVLHELNVVTLSVRHTSQLKVKRISILRVSSA